MLNHATRSVLAFAALIALESFSSATAQEARPAQPGVPAASLGAPEANTDGEPSAPRGILNVLPIGPGARDEGMGSPGDPPRRGRPRPGSIFDPGASGPGIRGSRQEPFLDGALDPDSGWPFVFLDHFAPRPERVANSWIVDTRQCPQVMGTDP